MKGDPLLWIAGIAILGCLLIVLASVVLKMRRPLERDRVERLIDEAQREQKQTRDRS
jgi:di/tricarboxylate transporter